MNIKKKKKTPSLNAMESSFLLNLIYKIFFNGMGTASEDEITSRNPCNCFIGNSIIAFLTHIRMNRTISQLFWRVVHRLEVVQFRHI